MNYNKVLHARENYYILFALNFLYLTLINALFTPIEYINILILQNVLCLTIYQIFLIIISKKYEVYLNIPNLITNYRLVINIYIFSMILNSHIFESEMILFFALISLILDGFDGKISRIINETSEFGNLFDQETDNILMLILVISLIINHSFNIALLLIPLYRYIFLLLIKYKVISNDCLPPSNLRKFACVCMIISLIFVNYFNNLELLVSLMYIIIILITFSFLKDINWLYRRNK